MPWSSKYRENGTDIVRHIFAWLSDGSGNASVVSSVPVSGEIQRVVFIHGTGGVAPQQLGTA